MTSVSLKSKASKVPKAAPTPSFDRIEMPVAVWKLAISGRTRFLFHQYGVAQEMFGKALALDPPFAVRSILVRCYVTSGYLALLQSARRDEAEKFTGKMIETYGPGSSEDFSEAMRFLRGD